MIPQYVDFDEDAPTIDLSYNISKTFPMMSNNFSQFRDFIYFLNKIASLLSSTPLVEKFQHCFFNNFLLTHIQPQILSNDIKIVRTTLQYITLIAKSSTNLEILNGLFHFLFGFEDSKTKFLDKQKHMLEVEVERESIVSIKNKPKRKNKASQHNIRGSLLEKSQKTFTTDETFKKNQVEEDDLTFMNLDDFNFKKHFNVDIALVLINNIKTTKELTNIVIFCLLEIFIDKCPLKMVQRVITPFIEVVLKKAPVN